MKSLKRIFNIQFIVIFSLLAIACESMLDVDLPSDQLTPETVFADSAVIESAANALYTENYYLNPLYYYLIPYYGAVISDEATHEVASLEVFNQNSYESATSAIANIWTYAYSSMFLSNSLIERLAETTAISEARKNRFISEAKYFRAYNHFVLVNFYGDVPLVISSNYKENMVLAREKTEAVYEQIIADLKDAEAGIGTGNTSVSKVTKAAVTALLARVYLYAGRYAEAEAKAGEVIANTSFALEEADKVFLRSSKETILKMQDFRESYIGRTYWGGYLCSRANYTCLRDGLMDAFEDGDQRMEQWTKELSNRGYKQSVKYKQASNPSNSELAEDHIFLRLGEQYLIRAEARAMQSNLSGAIEDLNAIRSRASLPALDASLGQADVLLAVEQERFVELFAEEAHRWWDLKRTGRIDAVLGKIENKKWQSHKALWPIPEAQMNANPNLVPNPGYGAIE